MKRDEFLKAFDADAQPAPGSVTATYKKAARPTLNEALDKAFAAEFDGDTKEALPPVSVTGMAKRIAEERKAAAAEASAPLHARRASKGGKIAMTPDGPVIGFGAHRGKLMRDVPSDYLRWILKQDFDATVVEAVQRELGNR